MFTGIFNHIARLSLVQRFTFVSLIFMLAGSAGIGWWVGEQIKIGVVKESAATTALYMDSFIDPNLQELSHSASLTPEHISNLTSLLNQTAFGSQIVAFKVWDSENRILYSANPVLIGRVFPSDGDIARAWQGEVVASISNLQDEENVEERLGYSRLLQIYSPVRLDGTGQTIAVAEFYQKIDTLDLEIATAQRRSWLVLATTMLSIFLLLVGFVNRAGRTINVQKTELTQQVAQLTELMTQNDELNGRIKRAAANATAINERFLRRISAELHDGPTQDLGLALLRLGHVIEKNGAGRVESENSPLHEQLPVIQDSLNNALTEMRTIAAGLGLPQLEKLTLAEVFSRAIRSHERRTGTQVVLETIDLPAQAALSVKITVYRLVQEALNNAHRHAKGIGQQVRATCKRNELNIEITDQGPGFDVDGPIDWDEHLGLAGMRERVESLGGLFRIESEIGKGTKVVAHLMLKESGVRLDE